MIKNGRHSLRHWLFAEAREKMDSLDHQTSSYRQSKIVQGKFKEAE
jgi:hypothetical protein